MADDSLVDVLEDVGLSTYQSRAYEAAIGLGTARFSTLSEESGVPQQRIYDVVDDLAEMGLLEVHEAPGGKQVVTFPPESALNELKERRIDEFSSTIDGVIDDLQGEFNQVDPHRGVITVLDHESSAKRHIGNAIDDADWWLFLSVRPGLFDEFRDEIEAAIDRGVTVRLLLHGPDVDPEDVDPDSYPDDLLIRSRPAADSVITSDRSYGVFRGLSSPGVPRPYLVARDQNIVEMLRRYTEQIWTGSTPIHLERGYPRRYPSPWYALRDVADHLAEGTILRASVEGHRTESGRQGSWAGPIEDHTIEVGGDQDALRSIALPYVATLSIRTDEGVLTVGGWDATMEDIAAYGIEVTTLDDG